MLLILLAACHRQNPLPQNSFDQVRLSFLQGNLASARIAAHEGYQASVGRNPLLACQFRILEAEILANQGLSQVELSILKAEIPSSLSGTDANLDVRRHMLQALAYSHLGDVSLAGQNLQQAKQFCDRANCSSSGEVARIDGAIEAERNHPERAEQAFRASLQIAQLQGDKFLEASDLLNLGVVAMGKEHYDESIGWSRAASTLAPAIHANLTEEKALGNLGWAYYKMGDFESSRDYFMRATRSAHELGAVIDEVEWLNNQGLTYFQDDNFSEAEKYYRQSLELAQSSQNKVQTIAALTALAFVSFKTGSASDAANFSSRAFQMARAGNDRPDELGALLVQAEIAQSSDKKRAAELLSEVAGDPQSDTSLRWEAQNGLARLYESENQPAAADKQYRKALGTLERARSSIRHEEFRLPFLANATHLYDDYVHFLVNQGNEQGALAVADFSRAQTLLEGLGELPEQMAVQPPVLNARQVARALNGTILFYWLGSHESLLWAITSRKVQMLHLPPKQEIEELVTRYNLALHGPENVLETKDSGGQKLFAALIEPAEKLIPHNSNVFIIPDGNLNTLNFETLLVPAPAIHYWIDDAIVTDANSLRLLPVSTTKANHQNRNVLLVGDPVAESGQFGELPNAAAEMHDVATHFPPTARVTLQREQATTEAYLSAKPENFSYIHFVAHGTASELNPLDSAIVLSKSAQSNSFKLYARDIIQHPLHAELVTISSCYGQGARAFMGEGLVGLSWAFLRAGAHNVIGALWEVSDTSTPKLMDHFYDELEGGAIPAVALRQAKLQMVHSNSVLRRPFYWAPFQLYTRFQAQP